MTLKCPACKSDSIRRSHARHKDGGLQRLLFHAYRCRNCHQRFFRLASAPWIAAAILLLSVAAIAFGWTLAQLYIDASPAAEQADAPPLPAAADLGTTAKPVAGADEAMSALADRGDAKAQFQLGMSYRNGTAGKPDPGLAYQWLAKSAAQGYPDAQYAVGTLHLAGHGVLQSFPSAFEWFERAAQQNHAEAQYNLGRMYRRGYGVPTDNVKAYVWFNLAAAQGNDRAREARDSLLTLMTPDQVKAAQHESQQWRPLAAKE